MPKCTARSGSDCVLNAHITHLVRAGWQAPFVEPQDKGDTSLLFFPLGGFGKGLHVSNGPAQESQCSLSPTKARDRSHGASILSYYFWGEKHNLKISFCKG